MSVMLFKDELIINDMRESDVIADISDFINNANIKFCSEATLDIRSCNIGKNEKIKERIEKCYEDRGYKLTVKTYAYPIFPSGIRNPVRSVLESDPVRSLFQDIISLFQDISS